MKKKLLYTIGGIGIVFIILLGTSKKIREILPIAMARIIAVQKQELWFHSAKIDSLFSGGEFRYFLFYKEKDLLIERDSTLLILDEDIYCSDTTISDMKNKVYIHSSAFPFLMKEENKSMLCRIDSVERENGMTKYKLRKIDFLNNSVE